METTTSTLEELERRVAQSSASFDDVRAYVEHLAPGDVDRAKKYLLKLKTPAARLGRVQLMLRVGTTWEARSAALQFLREYPWGGEELRMLSEPNAADIVRSAEAIHAAEQDVRTVMVSRNQNSLEGTLVRLRAIAQVTPLCIEAQKEHQTLCEASGALSAAEELYRIARAFPEPWPLLASATAVVAVAAGTPERGAELLTDALAHGADARCLAAAVSTVRQRYPDHAERFLACLTSAKLPPSVAPLLETARQRPVPSTAPPRKVAPSKPPAPPPAQNGPPDPNSPRAILESCAGLETSEARAQAKRLDRDAALGIKPELDVLFRHVVLAHRAERMNRAKKLFKWLAGPGGPDPRRQTYVHVARQLLNGTPLTSIRYELPKAGVPGKAAAKSAGKTQRAREGAYGPPVDRGETLHGSSAIFADKVADLARRYLRGEHPEGWRVLRDDILVAVERRMIQALISDAKQFEERSAKLTELVELRVRAALADRRRNPDWNLKTALIALHLLSGTAEPTHTKRDRVGQLLQQATTKSAADPMANYYLWSGQGPFLWNTLVALGNRGYRMNEITATRPGFSLFDLVLGGPAEGLPSRLGFVAIWNDQREVAEGMKQALSELSNVPLLVAVYEGNATFRLQSFGSEVARYGAEAVALEGLEGDALIRALERAEELAGSIPNPVRAFPFTAQHLRTEQLVARPRVVTELEAALGAQPLPLAIYCMRKAGKTATARLLETTGPATIMDLRRTARTLRTDPGILLGELEAALPTASDRTGLLVLDEFDYLARELATQPEAVALDYLNWLGDAAQGTRVLCLGLDPFAFRSVYPASNPLQSLPEYRLRYFDRDECAALTRRMAGALSLDDELMAWLFEQSGGHPGVLRGLMEWCIEVAFGKDSARIPTHRTLKLDQLPVPALRSELGHAQRAHALRTILDTRLDAQGLSRDAWRLLEQVVVHLPPGQSRSTLFQRAAGLDLGLSQHPTVGLDLLESWGLLSPGAGGTLSCLPPLLYHHLRTEQKLADESNPPQSS